MLRGLLRFFAGVLLIGIVGYLLNVPWYFTALVGSILGAIFAAIGWYLNKEKLHTQKVLASQPFRGQLPYELGQATMTAVALEGDDSYGQRLVGESAYQANFADLMKYAGLKDGDVLEVQAALVAEPANKNSVHAVAVTCGGSVLGYIPEFESEALYSFLLTHRGMARVNSNIYFRIASQTSYVELDLTRPYTIVPGV